MPGPRSRIRSALSAVAASVAIVAVLFALAEAAVRLAGGDPPAWPAPGAQATLPGVRVDPLLGPLLRPGWSGQWIGWFEVIADEHGFRSTGVPPPPRPRRRIAFLGDSCTFGWGVDTPDTFVARLAARQRDAGADLEMLNAGYPGQSAIVGRYMLAEKVLPLRPDVVVLGFSANNAFRLSVASDAERFRFLVARRLLLRSRLLYEVAVRLARRSAPALNPRDRAAVAGQRLSSVKRLAAPDEFEAATRAMVSDARRQGAAVVLLVFPRAVEVSPDPDYAAEDAARAGASDALLASPPGTPPTLAALGVLEASCLDHRVLPDPLAVLREQRRRWRPVYPSDATVALILRDGAESYAAGDLARAAERFAAALEVQADSPLALYDLGVVRLAMGDTERGLAALEAADRHACNVFLQYQVILWKLGIELHVPVVDLTPHFQAHGGGELLFDPAHANAPGHRVIADAVWPALARVAGS